MAFVDSIRVGVPSQSFTTPRPTQTHSRDPLQLPLQRVFNTLPGPRAAPPIFIAPLTSTPVRYDRTSDPESVWSSAESGFRKILGSFHGMLFLGLAVTYIIIPYPWLRE